MKANKNVAGVIAILCAGILPITVALWSAGLFQSSNTLLFIDPPSISYETLVVGQRFSINISVANVTDLKGFDLKLSFNTQMLDVVGVAFPEGHLPLPNWSINDSLGVILMNVTYKGSSITATDPVSLAIITFKTMTTGESPLHLYDTKLVDSLGNPIPHDTADGLVLIVRHDVAIIDVNCSISETYIGRSVNVTVIAGNYGDVAENFTVKVYHNDTVFGTLNVTNLAPSENTTIIFTWDTNDVVAGYAYSIKAEATILPNESNTTNNVFVDGEVKIKIVGDVNNDNMVNIDDLIAWDAAYGSHEGELGWDPQSDINGDGVVDQDDGMLIIQNYRNEV